MKCPWCNAELKDGSVLCPTCGNEINMVPDFDPEIEDQCRETIETMTKDIFSTDSKKDKSSQKKISNASQKNLKSNVSNAGNSQGKLNNKSNDSIAVPDYNKDKAPKWIFFIVIFAALIIASVIIIIIVTSDSYKLSQAQKAYAGKEYDKARGLYEVLLEKEPDDLALLTEYSYVLFDSNKTAEYETVLYKIVDNADVSDVQKEQTYERLIYLYSGQQNYQKIYDLITTVGNPTILEKYKDFLTHEPELVIVPGLYDLPQMMSISGSDEIYYTLVSEFNGNTTVLAEDEIYRLPVLMEIGTYKLTTYSKNKYGLTSDVVEAKYIIEIANPLEPELSLPEGEYISPQLLEVFYDSDNIIVYYTSDGSEPDATSQMYTGSIFVPYGMTTYKFVSVDKYGLTSNIVSIVIDMQYEYEVMPDAAYDMLIEYLLEKGTIVSEDGIMPEGGCLNLILTGFAPVGKNYCYVFDEAMIVDDIMTYLDVRYSVDMITGEISKIE